MIKNKLLGIPNTPSSIDTLLNGAAYAALLDCVPAHLSIIIQAIRSNLSAGNACVLVTQMSPGVFLSMAQMSGVDFRGDIEQNKLFLFSPKDDCATNIFRHGIRRLLQEFDFFEVPRGSFILFDQAEDIFTMSDQNIAQVQAAAYRDWMKAMENTALFLFSDKDKQKPQAFLGLFNGVLRISQNKSTIELLVDFWYSQESVIAAQPYPLLLDSNGLIRVGQPASVIAGEILQQVGSDGDYNTVYFLGPDFDTFKSSLHHDGNWIRAQSIVDLIHLSRDAVQATIVMALDCNSDLEEIAKSVHFLRMDRGNRLKIVIKESGFSLRYMNELLLLRFGASLIIHQQVAKQQLPLIWEMLAGHTYTRKIKDNFDISQSSLVSSNYKGYVDLVTFCNESLGMFERGDVLDIPFVLVDARYHEQASPPEILGRIMVERIGDIYSSDEEHCYIFIYACEEENSTAALSRITGGRQASLFQEIRYITAKQAIRDTLELKVQSGNIAMVPDYSMAIAQLTHAGIPGGANTPGEKSETAATALPFTEISPDINKPEQDAGEEQVDSIEDALACGSLAATEQLPVESLPESDEKPRKYAFLINRLAYPGSLSESVKWPQE